VVNTVNKSVTPEQSTAPYYLIDIRTQQRTTNIPSYTIEDARDWQKKLGGTDYIAISDSNNDEVIEI
jgi:hypothetical protein